MRLLCLQLIFTELLGYGTVAKGRKRNTWTKDGPVYWHVYAQQISPLHKCYL